MDSASHSLTALQQRIGYTFEQRALLEEALTHPSFLLHQSSDSPKANNQRLEFLGDAVLGMILGEVLFHNFPDEREGFLTRARAALIKGGMLARLARTLQLSPHLRLAEPERANGIHEQDTALEDALEALIGAIYLDSDYPTTRTCVLGWYGDLPSRVNEGLEAHNPKGQLQELLQQQTPPSLPIYRLISEDGPEHERSFEVEVVVHDVTMGHGRASSKKVAEQEAATKALKKLNEA